MADTKISALTAATTLADTDELVLASAGASKKITGANLKASMPAPSAGALTLLRTTTLASAAGFDESSISGSYNDLVLVLIARSTNTSLTDDLDWKFNADGGANYYREIVEAAGATVSGSESIASTLGIRMPYSVAAASSPSGLFGVVELTIYGYASTSWRKTMSWHTAVPGNTATGGVHRSTGTGLWNSTAAITRVQIAGENALTFQTGSQLRIYGRL